MKAALNVFLLFILFITVALAGLKAYVKYTCQVGEIYSPDCPTCLCTHYILDDGRIIAKGQEVVNDYITKRKLKYKTLDYNFKRCRPNTTRQSGQCWTCTCAKNGLVEYCINDLCEDVK